MTTVTSIVVDSSIIVALVTPEEYSSWAMERIKEFDSHHILDFSFYEVANAIKNGARNKVNPTETIEVFDQALEIMELYDAHDFSEVIKKAMGLAIELDIAVYDAAFLTLAAELGTQLLTLDLKLTRKLERTKYQELTVSPTK